MERKLQGKGSKGCRVRIGELPHLPVEARPLITRTFPSATRYKSVDVFYQGESIAQIKVEEVH